MSTCDFQKSIDFIADHVFPKMGVSSRHFLTVEYLGGEVLLIPENELRAAVHYARDRLGSKVAGYRDGAQSNLIGSERRILDLHDLFQGRIGTSWDQHSGQRHIHGSVALYQGILKKSLAALQTARDHAPGRVLVVDAATAPHLEKEVKDAISGGYDLVLRPVFQGGSDGIDPVTPDAMSKIMEICYRIWSENPTVRVQPFDNLFRRRLARGRADAAGHPAIEAHSGCPFQSDCAFKSMSLDPDGTMHICQEMADAGHYPLGNAIRNEFDEKTWRLLARRTAHLSADCQRCEWRTECGGGCMNEAVQAFGDPFAKTELCPVWKTIFRSIEADITSGRAARIERTMTQ